MAHVELDFVIAPLDPWRDILIAELSELGFTGFEETSHGLRAYIEHDRFDRAAVAGLLTLNDPHATVSHTHRTIQPRNWNADWEASFQPIEIDGRVRIRA